MQRDTVRDGGEGAGPQSVPWMGGRVTQRLRCCRRRMVRRRASQRGSTALGCPRLAAAARVCSCLHGYIARNNGRLSGSSSGLRDASFQPVWQRDTDSCGQPLLHGREAAASLSSACPRCSTGCCGSAAGVYDAHRRGSAATDNGASHCHGSGGGVRSPAGVGTWHPRCLANPAQHLLHALLVNAQCSPP